MQRPGAVQQAGEVEPATLQKAIEQYQLGAEAGIAIAPEQAAESSTESMDVG